MSRNNPYAPASNDNTQSNNNTTNASYNDRAQSSATGETGTRASDAMVLDLTSTQVAELENNGNTRGQVASSQSQVPQDRQQDQPSQQQALMEQLKALQAQVEELQETNFDLEATMATMQAEQAYSLQKVASQAKEETSKLKHALRLEQQTNQRFRKEEHYPPQSIGDSNIQSNHSKRQRSSLVSSTEATFARRLPPATYNNASQHVVDGEDDADQGNAFSPSDDETRDASKSKRSKPQVPREIQVTSPSKNNPPPQAALRGTPRRLMEEMNGNNNDNTDTNDKEGGGTPQSDSSLSQGVVWLAQQLLLLEPSFSSHEKTPSASMEDALEHDLVGNNDHHSMHEHVRQMLLPIASQSTLSIPTALSPKLTEAQLMEYLLQEATVDYWQTALHWSRACRTSIMKALATLEDTTVTSTRAKPSRSSRIQRLNADSTAGKALDDRLAYLRQNMQEAWYVPGSTDMSLLPPDAGDSDNVMDVALVQDWVGCRLDQDNPAHLNCLSTILEDCPSNSTTIWWKILLPGLTLVLFQLHYQLTTYFLDKEIQEPQHGAQWTRSESANTASWQSSGETPKTVVLPSRSSSFSSPSAKRTRTLLRFRCPKIPDEDMMPKREQEKVLEAILRLFHQLLRVTRQDVLNKWYMFESDLSNLPTHQPYQLLEQSRTIGSNETEESMLEEPTSLSLVGLEEEEISPHLWIGLLLDIVEEVVLFDYREEASVPSWYPYFLQVLPKMGETNEGLRILRTRLPPMGIAGGGEIGLLSNALDVGLLHLCHLSLCDEHDEVDRLTEANRRRLLWQDQWIRLWHQVLLFIQQQPGQQENHQPLDHGEMKSNDLDGDAIMEEEATSKSPTPLALPAISFRSLVLDMQMHYTAACARILTDPWVRPEIHSMIRLQLEELSMDEEEHEELKE